MSVVLLKKSIEELEGDYDKACKCLPAVVVDLIIKGLPLRDASLENSADVQHLRQVWSQLQECRRHQ